MDCAFAEEEAAKLSEACKAALERLRVQLEREPGRFPTLASVKDLSVRLPWSKGVVKLGSLGSLHAEQSGVGIRLLDPARGEAVLRALSEAKMTGRAGRDAGWVTAEASPYLGRRLAERCGPLAMAAKEAMREERRKARRRGPSLDWSPGSKLSQEVAGVMEVFEEAVDELCKQARGRC